MHADIIYLENDALFFLDNPTDKDGNSVNDATVSATLFAAGGGEVSGETWPLTLDYVAGSKGRYEKVVDKALGVAQNSDYQLKITVVANGSSDGVFWKDVQARKRII